MSKIFNFITVFAAFVCLQTSSFGQVLHPQAAAGNASTSVDYRGATTLYTDAQGPANPYNDDADNTLQEFVPVGVGTRVRVAFTSIDIEANDELRVFEDNSDTPGNESAILTGNPGTPTYTGQVGVGGRISFRWVESGGATGAAGWEANLDLVNNAGQLIDKNVNWVGFAEGNGQNFIFDAGGPEQAYVFCGLNASVRWVMDDDFSANSQTFEFKDLGSYLQRLDSVYVRWGDGSTYTNSLGEGFNVDQNANRNAYDATGQSVFNTPAHPYAAVGRYTVTITGVDELGVRSTPQTIDIIIEGNQPTAVNAPDVQVCDGDPATIVSDVEWEVDNYDARIISQRWEGPEPGNPGNNIVLKTGSPGDNFLNIPPSQYPAPADGDALGYNDYTFCHYVTFDNGCGEQETCINYRVYKLPNAGEVDPNADNEVCEDLGTFDLNTLIRNQDPTGTWFDASNTAIPNGILTPVPGEGSYNYTYTVSNPECPSDQVTATLIVVRKPYAGTNDGTSVSNPLKLCVDQQNVDLFNLLDGNAARPTPDINGQWFLVEGGTRTALNSPQINSSRFLDASQFNVNPPTASKLFRLCYQVVDQTGECDPVEECVFVRIYPEPYVVPTMVDTQVCEGDAVITMDNLVDDAFRTSGNWQNYEWPAAKGGPVSNQAFFEPNKETVPGIYKYRKYYRNPDNNNADICRIDSIIVTVEFFLKPEAGPDANYTICPSQPIDLYDTLKSAADIDGTFYGPLETVGDVPTANPNAFEFDTDGGTFTFRYEVTSNGPCPEDEATLTFNVSPFKDPGMANSIIVCTSDAPIKLIDELNGTPDNGGTWSPTTGLTGTGENATFNAGAAGAGNYTYTYTFPKNGACPAASAVLDIEVYNQPVSGNDFSETICNVDDNKQQYFYELADQISGAANGANFGLAPQPDVMEEFGALEAAADAVTNSTTGSVNVNNLGGGTYNFFYRTFNIGCDADTAFFTITVNQVGDAGKDSLFVRCSTEPSFPLKNFLSAGADNFGTWEDTDGTGAISSPPNFNANFVPSDVEQMSPDTGFRLIYIVEVDECPDDSANVVAYVSEAPRSGVRKLGTDSLLYACEDENSVDLLDALVNDTYTEPEGNPNRPLTGQWRLIKPNAGYLMPQAVFDEVNVNNRDLYFTGGDSSQFDMEALVQYWEGTEAFPGSRQYAGGVDNISFWEFLKKDRILYFEYTVRDTSAGKLRVPDYYEGGSTMVPREINCPSSSTVIQSALMPDYDKRFTLEVTGQGQLTVCNSITDLDLKLYFNELQSDQARLDIPDIFNNVFDEIEFEGIDPLIAETAIYPQAPNNQYFLDVSQLDPTFPNFPSNAPPPYNLRLRLESGKDANNKCGEARTQVGLSLDVEKVPAPGGFPGPSNEPVSQFSICEGSPSFDIHAQIEGTKDTWDPSAHFFTSVTSNANGRIQGKVFNTNGAVPNLYIVRYNIPTVACVSPTVSSINDPARATRPKRFTSLVEITITSGPDLDGYDAKVNTFDICSEPATNLGRLFPQGNDIDQSGEFKILTGCGSISFPKDWNNAVYTRGTGTCGSVLIEYTVTKDDCPPAKLQMRLNITDKPFPGVSGADTVCLDNGLVDMFEILAKNYQGSKVIDRTGTFRGRTAKADAAVNLGGFFDPSTSGVGKFQVVYTVGDGAICELDSAVATIVVQRIQRTGTDGSVNACLGQPKLDLFDGLNGFYDVGGTWIPQNPALQQYLGGPQGSLFDHTRYRNLEPTPASSLQFRYVIDANCATDTSVVTVFLTPGPVSGRGDTTVFVCNKLFEYNLFDALGEVNSNEYLERGIWRGINGTPNPSYNGVDQALISPENMANGSYAYRYTVEAECGDTVLTSSTEVTVKIGQNISAGTSKTLPVCYTNRIDLSLFFGVSGGKWVDTNDIGGLVDVKFFDLELTLDEGLSETYQYAYVVPEVYKNCGSNAAFYTLEIRKQPNAGRDTTVFYCKVAGSDFDALILFPDRSADEVLKGDAGITAANALSGGRFFPSRLNTGTYALSLIITDSECGSDTAIASIIIGDPNDPNSFTCGDLDGDGVRNIDDLDVDGDGISNIKESNGVSPFGNHDNDAILNYQDRDFALSIGSDLSNKGVVIAFDFDNDGKINALDLDSDNDLIADVIEAFGFGNPYDPNNDGITVSGPNGINTNTAPLTPLQTTAGKFDFLNLDSDGDGIGDFVEGRPTGADSTQLNFNIVDTDLDDTPDYQDLDSDDDTVLDRFENVGGSLRVAINTDANPAPGRVNTDNIPDFRDTDSDGDEITDRREAYLVGGPGTAPGDFDGDGIANIRDLDSDNDGISDNIEKGPTEIPRNTDLTQLSSYSTSDANPDFIDYDSDGDGILDIIEAGGVPFGDKPVNSDVNNVGDLTADAREDYRDLDSDGDRIPDMLELGANGEVVNTDGDVDESGYPLYDYRDADSDNDQYLDIYEAEGTVNFSDTIATGFVDFDFDGIPDYLDFDSDNDGIFDRYEVVNHDGNISKVPFDADEDGVFDFHDEDSDDDGLLDSQERGEGMEGSNSAPRDSDEDGRYDFRSIDADGDGILDRLEGDGDCDGDGIPNYRDAGDNCQITTFIPEAFSPNEDRVNDFFVIPDAGFFPGNTLSVYNRWGGLVFEMENYDNTWDGTKDGTLLPDGTYFYTFDLGIGQKPLTGFVYISTNN